ncbi:hypothetical protein [Mitsuaria sp. GD03876]|uniref:hypothetical protein n=1 Tax=Mitsuaria sp. GD03876 TaxID=2975399 RepID=UPI00244CA132|nr:hypothetical protein [Mitsuaria sp. GD03876]MDH0867976.1 hypothetical protein [Mitsuaria sp. GD03876]
MITLHRSSQSSRPGPARERGGNLKVVDACLHGLALPKKGCRVHVTKIASWTLEWWPHRRQRALYAALEAQELTFWPTANGFEMCRLGARFDFHYMVVRRDPDRISIEGLLSQLPDWKAN